MSKLQDKYQRTYDYLQAIADTTPDGYFYINIDKAWRDLDISKRALYRHLDKLSDKVYKVYNGTFVPEGIVKKIFKDSDRKLQSISSLYYIPKNTIDSQLKRDTAIIRYCFGWDESKFKHFLWWADLAHLELDENMEGLSKVTQGLLQQYFDYVVDNKFDFDGEMDRFLALTIKWHSVFKW